MKPFKNKYKKKQVQHPSRETGVTKKKGIDVCLKCGKPGHWARGCRADKVNEQSNDNMPRGQALTAQATLCLDQSQCNTEIWYLDSGATDHMCNKRQPQPVNVGKKNESVYALGRGDINILAFDGMGWTEKHLSQVLFVPNLRCNLFSAGAALDKGLIQISTAEGCRFEKNGIAVAVGVRKYKLCEMQFRMLVPGSSETQANFTCKVGLQTWHERLAHQNVCQVKQYLKIEGIHMNEQGDFFREACVHGKAHRLPFPKRKLLVGRFRWRHALTR
ncbi:uncharacterized protein LOC143210476 [Lasioglossum baleicum]|uniref:uncharacterized protein LOC143210476 n=1 Tax=Lasioglossum baleicum TaxID=434251 RepID=UPI003FCD1162